MGEFEGEGEGVAATTQVVDVQRPDKYEQPSETFTTVNGEGEQEEVPKTAAEAVTEEVHVSTA